MPLTAVFNIKPQTSGVQHANRDTGGSLQLGETASKTYASPAQGVVPSALTGDFRAGGPNPASVFGTGDNPDLIHNGGEAV